MQFEVNGVGYGIEFRRETREVRVHDPFNKDVIHKVKSTYPFTTVNITLKSDKPKKQWEVAHTATVGCFKSDAFSAEEGRRYALRSLCKKLPKDLKDLKTALWQAYLTRKDPKPAVVPVADTNEAVATV